MSGAISFLTGFASGGRSAVDMQTRRELSDAITGETSGGRGLFGTGTGTRGQDGIALPREGAGGTEGRLPSASDGGSYNGVGLPPSLIRTESSGDWNASNNVAGSGGVGHFGRGQFSRGRLQDAANAGVIPQGVDPQAFMADPEMQQRVEEWHVSDINGFISSNGLDRYVGQSINGQEVTPNGMLAVAHLGGSEGLRRYLTSGGSYNPSDDYGTSLSDYMSTHAGRPAVAQPQQPSQPQSQGWVQTFLNNRRGAS